MSHEQEKKKKVLLINCDWRNLFQSNPHELWEKFERDRLCPDLNDYFVFSWAHQSYNDENKNWKTVHKKTIFSWFKPWFDFLSYFSVPKALVQNNFKPNVVVVYDFGFMPTAKKISEKYGSTIVMVINNMPRIYSATRKLGFFKSMYSWFLEWAYKYIPHKYFTINDAMKSYLLDLGIPKEKIHLFAMDTINRDMQYLTQSTKGRVRQKYNIPEAAKMLICVARLEAEKGYERLIPLFSTLPDNFYLMILGEGSLRKELESLAEKLGVKDRIKMPGFIKRDEIWDYYNDSDVFVLLSKAEALGVVVWEAMYMRLPVLGSTAAGIIESTGENGERGLVLEDDDKETEFKEKIFASVNDTEEKRKRTERAYGYVCEKITNPLTLNDIV